MPENTLASPYRGHFWGLALSFCLLLGAVVTMNYLVDPYFIHQWDTPLLRRPSPAQPKFTPWAKTYAAYRYQPEVVFLGSSRAEIGLPTDGGQFPGKRVLNLALKGGTFGDAMDMLRHTSYFHRPEVIVWGVEYGWLFDRGYGNMDFRRMLVAKDSSYPFRRWLMNTKRAVAMDMTEDTLATLLGLADQRCPPLLATYGNKSAQCVEQIMKDEGGTAKAFAELMKKEPPAAPPDFHTAMRHLSQVTRDYCAQGTAFRFYIQPVHALVELTWWQRWDDVEEWKRALVKVVDEQKRQGCDILLMDFSGFNSITTEEIPQMTGKERMANYWEHSHYRSEVGATMLTKLFAKAPQSTPPADFGVALGSEDIEPHLQAVRQAGRRYAESHPQETKHLQNR